MSRLKTTSYASPACEVCHIQTEAVICASTEIDDLEVKDTHDWGWEE